MYDYTRTASAEFAAWMRGLPGERRERIGGVDVHMVHGSPLAVNDFLWESLSDDELRARLALCGSDVLLCSHTGIPWQRRVDGCLVGNVGHRRAAGQRRSARHPLRDARARGMGGLGGARARRLRLAGTSSLGARGGLARALRRDDRDGLVDDVPRGRPPPERSWGRYHVYREVLPRGFEESSGACFADTPELDDDGRPVVSLFGTAVFPSRLWIYTNFHCNLACDYCVVASSPRARRRELSLERVRALVDEAAV
ncbi:MAG TPA: hypothetical protein VGV57_07625 [Thermoleophilaceae bacterium]|nr:hypothetical protein [Thermoleophilaceae bacterium]